MHLYNVAENGSLRKTIKLYFSDSNRVYLVDDNNIIYLWQGQKASKKKKDLSLKKANKLNEERNNNAKVQVIHQNHEYGAFLAIMNSLKSGIIKKSNNEKRPELELEIDDTMELLEAGLQPDLIAEINLAAYDLAQKNIKYENLCRQLAQLQLSIIKGKEKITENEIKKKSKEIFESSSTHEEVCWLISQLKILTKKNYFKKK